MKKRYFGLLALLVFVWPCAAFAGGSAIVAQNGGHKSKIEWLDANTFRQQQVGEKNYLLFRNGEGYMVSYNDDQPQVMKISQMLTMMSYVGKSMADHYSAGYASGSFKATGKSATVAGVTGKVYRASWKNDNGTQHQNAVLTNNKAAVELTHIYFTLAQTMTQRNLDNALPKGHSGILRVKGKYELVKLSGKTPPADRFKLPAKPVNATDMIQKAMTPPTFSPRTHNPRNLPHPNVPHPNIHLP